MWLRATAGVRSVHRMSLMSLAARRRTTALLTAVLLSSSLAGVTLAGAAPAAGAAPDPATLVTFYVGLPLDTRALTSAARDVSSPGSPGYRSYASLRDVARAYGATDKAIGALVGAAARRGLVVRPDFTRTFARVTGTVRAWERAMGASITYIPAVQGSAAAQDSPDKPFTQYVFKDGSGLLPAPAWMRPYVTAMDADAEVYVPSLDIPGPAPLDLQAHSPRGIYGPDQPWPTNGSTQPGKTCAQPVLEAGAAYTPHQVNEAYGTSELRAEGARGADARVTVISLGGGFNDSDLKDAAECFGYRAPAVDVVLGDGIPSPIVSDSVETHLDLQTVSGVLRDATRIRLVQTVNDDDSMVDAYARALRMNAVGTLSPDVISLSYGACELADTRGNSPLRSALESLFRMAALVGTTVVASTGDQGSSVCQMADPPGLGLDPMGTISYPASSPFMTAVGGTRLILKADNTRADEVVWNDQPYGVPGAGTGGSSQLFSQPWYQSGITGSLARTVPDVSALAAIQPGWPVVYGGDLLRVGGTSGAAPFVGANLAMVSGQQRRAGEPALGFANPWLYLVQDRHPSAFFDVTRGDNQVAVRLPNGLLNVPACCEAAPGYDMASGLGSPNVALLAARAGLRP